MNFGKIILNIPQKCFHSHALPLLCEEEDPLLWARPNKLLYRVGGFCRLVILCIQLLPLRYSRFEGSPTEQISVPTWLVQSGPTKCRETPEKQFQVSKQSPLQQAAFCYISYGSILLGVNIAPLIIVITNYIMFVGLTNAGTRGWILL